MNAPGTTTRDPAELLARLRATVSVHGSAAVAFSAGVDSTVVLAVAHGVLGTRALGVMGISPSVPPAEVEAARALAHHIGARLALVPTHELDDPRYAGNPRDRCFFCKTELYEVCRRVVAADGLEVVLNGTNADDLGDWRPGLRAADAAGVRSPLLECGLGKVEVRAVARLLGLPNWDKPAAACLASRLPYGTAVTAERMAAVDRVERHLRAAGFRQVRARHHGETVRLEVEAGKVPLLDEHLAQGLLERVLAEAGFARAEVEPDGYRQGRLNDAPVG